MEGRDGARLPVAGASGWFVSYQKMESRMQEAMAPINSLYYSPAFVVGSFFIVFIPVIKLLRRTGHNPLWCFLAIVPVINVIAWWYFAFKPWPTDSKAGLTAPPPVV